MVHQEGRSRCKDIEEKAHEFFNEVYDYITIQSQTMEPNDHLAYFVKSLSGRYLWVNTFFAEIAGKTSPQIIGKYTTEIWRDHADVGRILANEVRMLDGGVRSQELLVITDPNGDLRYMNIYKTVRFSCKNPDIPILIEGVGVEITRHARPNIEKTRSILQGASNDLRAYLTHMSLGLERSEIAKSMGKKPEEIDNIRKVLKRRLNADDKRLKIFIEDYVNLLNEGLLLPMDETPFIDEEEAGEN